VVDAEPLASGRDRARKLLVAAREGGAEVGRRAQLLGNLRQRALVSADVFGQAALWRVAAKQRRSAALRGELLELVVADRAGVGQVEDPDFVLFAQPPRRAGWPGSARSDAGPSQPKQLSPQSGG
jgi:hypothetical protein